MTHEHEVPKQLGLEPEDLDGFSIEDLTDYLEAGCLPANPAIDESPGCQLALDALERLRRLTPDLLAADAAAEGEVEDDWVQGILDGILMEARAGRRLPLPSEKHQDFGVTEGAVRGLIRGAERAVPGVIVGRCRLEGEIEEMGADATIHLNVSVPYGLPIERTIRELRMEISQRVLRHTTLNVQSIDVTVEDVQDLPSRRGGANS